MLKIKTLSKLGIGNYGENLAKEFLKKNGYKIVVTNFSTRLGRNFSGHTLIGEIDIIAYDQDILCFIEVKTRTTTFLAPEKAVNLLKQRQISRVAKRYREIFNLKDDPIRFDVVAILLNEAQPHIELKRDFFPLILKPYYSWQRFLLKN